MALVTVPFVVWDDLKTTLGGFIGSNDVAGFILAGGLTLVIIVAMLIATSKSKIDHGEYLFVFSGILGIVLSVGFVWLPLWAGFILGVGLIVVLALSFGRGG